jgi:hypothetical protein
VPKGNAIRASRIRLIIIPQTILKPDYDRATPLTHGDRLMLAVQFINGT